MRQCTAVLVMLFSMPNNRCPNSQKLCLLLSLTLQIATPGGAHAARRAGTTVLESRCCSSGAMDRQIAYNGRRRPAGLGNSDSIQIQSYHDEECYQDTGVIRDTPLCYTTSVLKHHMTSLALQTGMGPRCQESKLVDGSR